MHGRTFYPGGWIGRDADGNVRPREGPYKSYVYNNTIFVKADIVSKYEMPFSARGAGALYANNVIYVAGLAEGLDSVNAAEYRLERGWSSIDVGLRAGA